jgi:hypothetical protein
MQPIPESIKPIAWAVQRLQIIRSFGAWRTDNFQSRLFKCGSGPSHVPGLRNQNHAIPATLFGQSGYGVGFIVGVGNRPHLVDREINPQSLHFGSNYRSGLLNRIGRLS